VNAWFPDCGTMRFHCAPHKFDPHPLIPLSLKERSVLVATVSTLDGVPVKQYLGLVTGEAILGANIFKDLFAGIRDIVGGRSAAYEKELRRAKDIAVEEMIGQARAMGATAVIGVDVDYQEISVGRGGTMLMVAASGTAVILA